MQLIIALRIKSVTAIGLCQYLNNHLQIDWLASYSCENTKVIGREYEGSQLNNN